MDYYTRLLDAPDSETRHRIYTQAFIEPWEQMMRMAAGVMPGDMGGGKPDPLAGARTWHWLLPDQTEQIATLLEQMERAGAWERGAEALATAAARFTPYADRIPVSELTGWLMLADSATYQPYERGYTGATDWLSPRFVGQFWEANDYNLPRLPGLVAHEMHHLIRLKAFPFHPVRTTVADYIVLEGTAESFAASLFGEGAITYCVTDFDPAQLDTARELMGKGLHATGFDVVRSYIFGDALAERSGYAPLGGMPTYGGYAIGYHVVQHYLTRSGRSIEEATFLPADEIVAGSGFFD